MADWAWKPTRHPARSPATAVVTTAIGPSSEAISESKASVIAVHLVTQEQGVVLAQDVSQREAGERRPGWEHGDGERVSAHHGRDGQAQLVDVAGHDQLAQQARPALAQPPLLSAGHQLSEQVVGLHRLLARHEHLCDLAG